MRLTTVLLIASLMQVSAAGFAQKISLSKSKATLKSIFREIKAQSGYNFIYTDDQLEGSKPVTINVKQVEVVKVLDEIFKDQKLSYSIEDKTVIIERKTPSFLEKLVGAITPAADIRGRVLDDKGEPLAGASVKVKGTSKSATTNAKGEFVLQGISENSVLVISYIGYVQREIAAGANLDGIRLELSNSDLDEVVINKGYYTESKRLSTGSIGRVTAEEIAKQPVSNVLAALQGKVPGLTITQTSGLPGGAFKVQIRGQNTLPSLGGVPPFDNPMFIIDGVPFAANNRPINLDNSLTAPGVSNLYNNQYGGISPFNSIDPAAIESIEVLKDADATAIYGSRGANGVVLITTKKGQAGKVKFSTNLTTGYSTPTRTVEMLDTKQYLEVRREAMKNSGITPTTSNAPDLMVFDTTKYTNWVNYVFRNTAKTNDVNTSFSGGNNNTTFRIGGSYHNETYILPGDFTDKRGSISSNFNHNSTDRRLVINFTAIYGYNNNSSGSNGSALRALTLVPNYPDLLDANGKPIFSYKGVKISQNPMLYLQPLYAIKTYNLNASSNISYQIYPEITLRSRFGYNAIGTDEHKSNPASIQDPATNPKGNASFGKNDIKGWTIEPQIEYRSKMTNGELNILLGATLQKEVNSSVLISGYNYANDALLNTLAGAGSTSLRSGNSEYKYAGISGRINYVLNQKYIVNLTGRQDASSRFGPGKQIGRFGSAAAAWIFSEENFLKDNVPFLSFGKIKSSYGLTGSDAIGDYQYFANWIPNTYYSYQGTSGYNPTNLFQPNYSWAVTKKFDVEMSLRFLNDRVSVNANWYRNRCGNQLVGYKLPIQTGFQQVVQNFPATVQNMGWEFDASGTIIKGKQLTWNTTFNLTVTRNKLTEFPGIETSSYVSNYKVGESTNSIRAFNYLYVDPKTGLFVFDSQNGPSSAPNSSTDRNVIVNLDPKFYGGMNNSFSYKGFQLDVFLSFRKQTGRNYLYYIYGNNDYIGNGTSNYPVAILSRWQKIGDQKDLQQFSANTSGPVATAGRSFNQSTGIYSDASFIRLQNIALSYSFPEKYVKKIGMADCRLYLNAQNLATWTRYKGSDPENQSYIGIPLLRTIVAGMNFTF